MKRRRCAALAGVAVALAMTVGAGSAAADTSLSHGGAFGRHFLADNEDHPNVHCRYDSRNVLASVAVNAPFLFARNRTSNLDRQLVSWRFRVQRDDGSLGNWTTIQSSTVQRAWTYEDRPATFSVRSGSVSALASRNYRVLVSMFWYKPGTTTVEGVANHVADWYHGGAFEPAFGPGGYCPGGIL